MNVTVAAIATPGTHGSCGYTRQALEYRHFSLKKLKRTPRLPVSTRAGALDATEEATGASFCVRTFVPS